MLNTANGQTTGLDRVLVGGYVAAAAAAPPEVVWTVANAHIATVICTFHAKNL